MDSHKWVRLISRTDVRASAKLRGAEDSDLLSLGSGARLSWSFPACQAGFPLDGTILAAIVVGSIIDMSNIFLGPQVLAD